MSNNYPHRAPNLRETWLMFKTGQAEHAKIMRESLMALAGALEGRERPRRSLTHAAQKKVTSGEITDSRLKYSRRPIYSTLNFTGFIFDFDPASVAGKRKPLRLIVDRRVGIAFSENVFYSQAPFKTKDHVKVLTSLETITGPTKIRRGRVE